MAKAADIIENEQELCAFTQEMEKAVIAVVNTVLKQEGFTPACEAVSYTHLDVYKRQGIRILYGKESSYCLKAIASP